MVLIVDDNVFNIVTLNNLAGTEKIRNLSFIEKDSLVFLMKPN